MTEPSSRTLRTTWMNLSGTMLDRLLEHKARLNVALQHPPYPYLIRSDLQEAQAEGFDPKTLWEQALRLNEDSKYQAPTWEEVAPTNLTGTPSRDRLPT